MSATETVILTCDGCGSDLLPMLGKANLTQARFTARAVHGWTYGFDRLREKKVDLCRHCSHRWEMAERTKKAAEVTA